MESLFLCIASPLYPVMDENDFETVNETITDGILFPNEMVVKLMQLRW